MDIRFDEAAHAGAEHLDPAYVAGYDRKARIDPTDDLELLRRYGLGADSVLVDFGAATGTFAISAARACCRVIAVEPSPAMTAALSRNIAEAGAANVTYVEAGFLSYEHEGPPVEFVYSRNALHHLPDFWKAIALIRVAEVLRPGGILHLQDLVYSFAPQDAESAIEEWLASGSVRPEDGWTVGELRTHLETEHSTFTWLLEPMLDRTGFDVVESARGRLPFYAEYVCRRR